MSRSHPTNIDKLLREIFTRRELKELEARIRRHVEMREAFRTIKTLAVAATDSDAAREGRADIGKEGIWFLRQTADSIGNFFFLPTMPPEANRE